VLNINRPSRSVIGCIALPSVIGAIGVTFWPSSSMTNSCSVTLVRPLVGTNPFRLLTNAMRPPGTGAGPRFSTPYPRVSRDVDALANRATSQFPAPVLGVNS
jgi:hypothetical protein